MTRSYMSVRRCTYCICDISLGPEKQGGAGQSTSRNLGGRRVIDRYADFVRKGKKIQDVWVNLRLSNRNILDYMFSSEGEFLRACEPICFAIAVHGWKRFIPVPVLQIPLPEVLGSETKGEWELAHEVHFIAFCITCIKFIHAI